MFPKSLSVLSVLLILTITGLAQTDSSHHEQLVRADKEAGFPGGNIAWRYFLEKNLNGSLPVDNGAPTGIYTVRVQFIINKDGILDSLKPLTKLGFGMEEELIRVMRKSGIWEPAVQNNRLVRSYRIQPATFFVPAFEVDILSERQYELIAGNENILTIDAGKIKPAELSVTISSGTIKALANGNFAASTAALPGERVIISVSHLKTKKELGEFSFEVVKK